MGNIPIFTYEELSSLKKEQLLRVADYLHIPVQKRWTQEHLVSALWERLEPPLPEEVPSGETGSDGSPAMSVRVRRIASMIGG